MMKWLLLLLISFNAHAALTAAQLVSLKEFMSDPPYVSMTPEAALAKFTTKINHTVPYYINEKSLYGDVGPDKAEAFLTAIRSMILPATPVVTPGMPPPAPPSQAAIAQSVIFTKILKWIEAPGLGLNIGDQPLHDWMDATAKAKGLITSIAFRQVLVKPERFSSPADDEWSSMPVTLADVIAARNLVVPP